MLKVTLEVSDPKKYWEFIDTILIDTIEGYSSFHWSPNYVFNRGRNEEHGFWYLPEDILVTMPEHFFFTLTDHEDGEKFKLSLTDIQSGFEMWASWCATNEQPIFFPGCSEWDCMCADQVIQFAVFKEILYS